MKNLPKYIFLSILPSIAVLSWVLNFIITDSNFSTQRIPSYLAQIIGNLAIAFLSMNFILSIRDRRLEKIMNGLDEQYSVHIAIGKIGFIFILFHILFLALRNFQGLETIISLLVPGSILIKNIGIFSFWILLVLLVLTLVIKLPYNIWKITHKFMIVPLILAGIHGLLSSITRGDYTFTSIFIIIASFIGVSAFIYTEFIYPRIGPIYFYIVSKVEIKGKIVEIFLKPLNKKMDFFAGQYAFFEVLTNRNISKESHPFSFSSSPKEEMRVSIKDLGDYTATLKNLNIGDKFKLIGPYGQFHLENFKDFKSLVFIAGGIGVTPFLSILRDLDTDDIKITVIYSIKNESDNIYFEEMSTIAKNRQNLKVFKYLSENEGYLNGEKIKNLVGDDFSQSQYLICGPVPMMLSVKNALINEGIKNENILFEKFTFKD